MVVLAVENDVVGRGRQLLDKQRRKGMKAGTRNQSKRLQNSGKKRERERKRGRKRERVKKKEEKL